MSTTKIWRMTKGRVIEGVFAINKPSGISSAQVVRDLQTHFNPSLLFAPWISAQRSQRDRENHNQRHRRKEKKIQVKIGHGGTLDPLATGVLITGVGKGTKALQNFLLCTKTYEAIVLFGADTDTYDRVGKILRRAPYEHVTRDMVEKALGQFRGKYMQLPPLFSALKMNGKPLYEYARAGLPIPKEIERREVEVLDLEMVEWMEGGTHNHKAPEENATHAEINVANTVWKQEGALLRGASAADTSEEAALQQFESKKRKLSQDQDDLVLERPPSKHGKPAKSDSEDDAVMSGGLAPPSEDSITTNGLITTQAITSSPSSSPHSSPSKGPPAAKFRMTVTSGFYVRSLCHDLGAAVGSAALMAELERVRQADFEVGMNVLEYQELEKGEEVWGPKVEEMLNEWMDRHPDDFGPQRRGGAARFPESLENGVDGRKEKRESSPKMEKSTENGDRGKKEMKGRSPRRSKSPRSENGDRADRSPKQKYSKNWEGSGSQNSKSESGSQERSESLVRRADLG